MNTNEEQNSVIIERAKAAILARDYDQAARIYKGLLKSDRENVTYLTALGDLYIKNNEDKIALDYYKEIVRLQPQNVDALNNLGGIFRRLKLYDESISVLERAVMLDSTNVQVFYNLGFTYKLMGNHEDAIQCFNTVVEENPRDVLAFNHIGTIYASEKKHAEAVSSYLKGLKVDPNHPILHLNLAKSYDKLGEFLKAQAEYEAALKSKPGWIEAIESYSDLLIKKNKTKTACEIVKKALNLNPKDAAMHTKLGDVYSRQDNFDDAESEYNTALAISPDFKLAMSGLASTYEVTGRMDEALEMAEKMERLSPEDPAVKRQHVHILLSADKIEKASEKIQDLYSKDPDDVHTLNLLGQYYICAGDEKKASGCFKKIKTLRPEYNSFYREAGKRHSQKGDYKKAEEFYQKYIDQNPEDTEGHKNLAKNYEDQGMLTQALSSYKVMESFDSSNIASRKGLERVNNQIILERDNKPEVEVTSGTEEFFDSDDDISIGDRVRVSEEVTLSFEDMNNPEPEFSTEKISEEKENRGYDFDGGFDKLQQDEITSDEIFKEGRLDEEIEADNQDHYAKSLDDLIGDVDLDDEGSGLEEDNTSAEDFFSNNPFGNGGKSSAPQENDFEPDFSMEEEEKPKKKKPAYDDVISLDEGWSDDEEFEEAEVEPEKPAPRRTPPKKRELPPVEDFAFEEDDEFPDDEKIEDEISEEPEYIPEPSLTDDDIIDEDYDTIDEESADLDDIVDENSEESEEDLPDTFTQENLDSDDEFEEEIDFEPVPEDAEDVLDGDVLAQIPDADEEKLDMEILSKAADAIQTVADAITENKVMKKTNVNAELFEKLRSLSTYLPEEKREEFLESKIRLQLDFIISKLSGKKGLLGTASILRNQIGMEDEATELDSGRTLLVKVLEYSKGLVRGLPDATMVSSLNGQLEELLSRI
ncbi:tetratricopeptide repeat protein [Treponema sp.]|uniref:tetratricopeptide repeat protein n=1 Tax=Treponema sp. TaxID=166 RepID=UPI00298DE730|nr:tetratricopeptide repeat protein [Treponema sp.]MCQ2240354.1 tetratricopeptide repeat protein [Treponema sp.]